MAICQPICHHTLLSRAGGLLGARHSGAWVMNLRGQADTSECPPCHTKCPASKAGDAGIKPQGPGGLGTAVDSVLW